MEYHHGAIAVTLPVKGITGFNTHWITFHLGNDSARPVQTLSVPVIHTSIPYSVSIARYIAFPSLTNKFPDVTLLLPDYVPHDLLPRNKKTPTSST